MNIKEMYENRARAWENAKAFLDEHSDQTSGIMSAEDTETYNRMEAEIDDLTKAIDRAERAEALEAKLNQPTSAPITNKPGMGMPTEPQKTGRASDQYRQSALRALRTRFKEIDNYLAEGTDADGGYLVPEEWDKRLVDVLDEENVMRSVATVIKTTGLHRINLAADKPAAAWIEEGGALTFDKATFSQITMDAYKLHVAVQVTEELLYDNAYNLEGYITTQFGKAIANAEEDAFLTGDGSSKPTGLFTSATAAVTGALTGDNLIDLIYALKRPYRKNAQFLLADANMAVIRKLKDDNGMYIWQPAYTLGEPDTILGYKALTSAYAPADQVAFGDYSYYNIGDRGTRSFQELRELYAANGLVGYVAKERVDGKLILPEAVQKLTVAAG